MRLFATRHSRAVLYSHVVWTTKSRVPVLDREVRLRLFRQAVSTANAFGAVVLAFGGTSDHLHVLLRYRPDMSVASLVRGLKAALTRMIRRDEPELHDFSWQAGYGAFCVAASDVDRVGAYILNQERHHALGTIWPDVELPDRPPTRAIHARAASRSGPVPSPRRSCAGGHGVLE